MIRILQCVNNMHRAGLETMLMNYYRNFDRSRIQFDFLTHRPVKGDYDDEIEALGGRVFYAPRLYPKNYVKYFSYMKDFFGEHREYKIVHSHIDCMSYLPLRAAKNAGIPVRIAHSHNTAIDLDYKYPLKQIFRKKISNVATDYFSCGEQAGKFLFGNDVDFHVIPNAIEADRFCFDEVVRVNKRKELNIARSFVIGHVGRMVRQKNHQFLLSIFLQILKTIPEAVLLLIGTGEEEPKIRNLVQRFGIQDKVIFLGNRSDVDELYQVMDVFVLPSLYEGVPVVGVEAQFSGLPCIFSDRVPKEVAFSSKCRFLSLDSKIDEWAKTVIMSKTFDRNSELFSDSIFRIENAYKNLEKHYLKLL